MSIFPQLFGNSVIAGAAYALGVLGFNLIYGATKFVNMAHGAVAAVGGYAVFFLMQSRGWGAGPSIAGGVLAAGAVGLCTDLLVYRPLRRRKASNLVLFIASLGIFTVLQSFLAMLFGSAFESLPVGGAAAQVFSIGGAAITGVQIGMCFLAAALFSGLVILLRFTPFGKVVRAVSDDEGVAQTLGINTERIVAWVFFIGSALAGVRGIFEGFDVGLQPTMGLFILLESATAAIIGGIGNFYGGVIGAFFLGFAENFGIWFVPSEWKAAIAFGILVLFLIFRPQGIMKQ